MHHDPIIKRRVITEKASLLEQLGKYVFLVRRDATKNEIKKAMKDEHKVDAVAISTIRLKPRRKRYRGRVSYKQQDKKAVVTLKQGQKIDTPV